VKDEDDGEEPPISEEEMMELRAKYAF